MENTFCLYLTNQIRFSFDNKLQPCCYFNELTDISSYTKEEFIAYREKLSKVNNWINQCHFCRDRENRGIISPRLRMEHKPEDLGIYKEEDIGNVTSLELQIDSSCNAACLMCNDESSTTWKKYNIGGIDNKSQSNKLIDIRAEHSSQQMMTQIKRLVSFDKVNVIVFLGGEPLGSDGHKQVLQECEQSGSLKNLSIRYVTNGSYRPDEETVRLWSQVKALRILFSIDGINDHFNYLRWPLQWNQVENNIQSFIDLKLPNISFGISSAISPFNIFYYDRYLAWEKEMFKSLPNPYQPRFEFAFDPTGPVNTSSIPPALMAVIKEKYADKPWLLNRMQTFDQKKYNAFMDHVTTHDAKRKLNWQEVFPEVSKYFT
jgi:molybdenum cofactor biosynthesis enzyme MoaA